MAASLSPSMPPLFSVTSLPSDFVIRTAPLLVATRGCPMVMTMAFLFLQSPSSASLFSVKRYVVYSYFLGVLKLFYQITYIMSRFFKTRHL